MSLALQRIMASALSLCFEMAEELCAECLAASKTLKLITGKGLHSEGNIARLLPAVEAYCREKNLVYHVNGGCVSVDIPDSNDCPDQNRYAYSFQDSYEHG